jgi:hypothetical protein
MSALLLSVLFWVQGIPVQPAQSGTIQGVLRTADSKPAAGIRVAAVPQTDLAETEPAGPTLSSLTETDENGRYKLENIPPGRYYIAAGRLDLPTYYPGTQSMAVGQAITISAGATIQGIDFTLQQTSSGRADQIAFFVTLLRLSLDVRVEGGGKLPAFGGGKLTTLQLEPIGAGRMMSFPLTGPSISLTPPLADYRIIIEGLPEGYSLKSLKYGVLDLKDGVLQLTGSSGTANVRTAAPSASLPPQVLSIVLDSTAASRAQSTGARVRGTIPAGTVRPIYLSGTAGTVFADGTFEFRNVKPGRHVILTLDNAPSKPALGASIVVGDGDLNDVALEQTPVLPPNPRALSNPRPAGTRSPGRLPLASLRGHLLDVETSQRLRAGTVYLVGDGWASCEIGQEGTFEFKRLLPGTYELEVHGIGYPTFRHTVVVEEQDLAIELKAG